MPRTLRQLMLAALVTTALLVQAEEIPRDLAGEIAALCKAAQSGETHSVAGVGGSLMVLAILVS